MSTAASSPRVSVVTISYNKGPFVDECLRSVVDQDCAQLQYIVVDAGSTDGSRDTIRRYADRIATLIEEPDAGPADGLNKGFARATGEILGYLNADDRFLPGALSFAVDYFERHPEIDVMSGAIRIVDEHGRPSPRKRTSDRFDLTRYAAGVCVFCQQATFFRRSAFEAAGGFNAENRIAWDGELMVDMALAGRRFAAVNKVLADFRIYGGSITGSGDYREKHAVYSARIAAKLEHRGVRLYSPEMRRFLRLMYKLNPVRHLRYLLV